MSQPCSKDAAFALRIAAGFEDDGGRRRSDRLVSRLDSALDAEWWLAGCDIHQLLANDAANCVPPVTHGANRTSP